MRLDTIDQKSGFRKLKSDYIQKKDALAKNKIILNKEKSIFSNNSKNLIHTPQSKFSITNNYNALIITSIESFEIKSLYKNLNKVTKGSFAKDKEFQNNIIRVIKNYNKYEHLFNKKDYALNINIKKINSKTSLKNAFTLTSMDFNVRKQYELEFDNEDKKKLKKKLKNEKNKRNKKKFFSNIISRKNLFESSKYNKFIYINQNVNSKRKSNNSKLKRNNKFIDDYNESNNDTVINLNNVNSFNKIYDKINNISNHNIHNILNDDKETCFPKKRKIEKEKIINDI